MAKIAIVLLSGQDNPGRALAGLHVAKRMHEARDQSGLESVEVFLFTQGVRLVNEPDSEMGKLLEELIAAGIVVGACTNQVNNWGLADQAARMGVQAEFARDAFARYAREGYTVMTF